MYNLRSEIVLELSITKILEALAVINIQTSLWLRLNRVVQLSFLLQVRQIVGLISDVEAITFFFWVCLTQHFLEIDHNFSP